MLVFLRLFTVVHNEPGPRGICYREMESIAVGMEDYRLDHGYFPIGSVTAVFLELTRTNSTKTCYVEQTKRAHYVVQWKDSFVDPWASTYIIIVTNYTVAVRSMGPNRKLGDSDDLTFPRDPIHLTHP